MLSEISTSIIKNNNNSKNNNDNNNSKINNNNNKNINNINKNKTTDEKKLNNNNNSFDSTEISSFDIYTYFQIYNEIFFENLLNPVSISWSKKMTSCAGVFSIYNNIPSIRLSEPLLKFRSITEIKETLLHEMIHAYCHFKKYDMSDDLSGHGKYFKMKMKEINDITGFNISVYHNFIDEVEYYTKYVWRCDGKCRNEKPYYGYVKRQVNRPPQKADKWWDEHEKKCGGKFIRIKPTDEEIENEKKKKKNKKKNVKNNKIDKFLNNNVLKEKNNNNNNIKNNIHTIKNNNNINNNNNNNNIKNNNISNKENNNKLRKNENKNIFTLNDFI